VLTAAGVFVLAVAAELAAGAQGPLPWPAWSAPGTAVVTATLLMSVAGLGACLVRDPFVMLLVSGLAGLGTAVLALFAGAPDVAFTQFTVEVAFVVVVAAVVLRVGRFSMPSAPPGPDLPRVAIALASGGLVTLLLLIASAGPIDQALPRYFGERSLPEAYGRNVVNVIIVDFRALDTLGEIAVVSLALMAALPLLGALRRRAGRSGS
jgi:multicomponent Na+:H+ antiporter subunit A